MYIDIYWIFFAFFMIFQGGYFFISAKRSALKGRISDFREVARTVGFDKNIQEYDLAEDMVYSNAIDRYLNKKQYRVKRYPNIYPSAKYVLLLIDIVEDNIFGAHCLDREHYTSVLESMLLKANEKSCFLKRYVSWS